MILLKNWIHSTSNNILPTIIFKLDSFQKKETSIEVKVNILVEQFKASEYYLTNLKLHF
jgi:hypothetical protein